MTEVDDQPAKNGEGDTTPAATPTAEVTPPVTETPQDPPKDGEEGQPTPTGDGSDPKPAAGDKPSRGERRIQELSRKVKEATQAPPKNDGGEQPDPSRVTPSPTKLGSEGLPWLTDTPGLIDDKGTIDLDKLGEEVERRAEQKVTEILTKNENRTTYFRNVNEWADDMEKTVRDNPELDPTSPKYNAKLDSALHTLVEATNFTADGVLMPRMKASTLLTQIKGALEDAKTKGQSETTAALARQIGEQAVGPGNGNPAKEKPSHEELRKQMKSNPQAVADQLERTLPHAED